MSSKTLSSENSILQENKVLNIEEAQEQKNMLPKIQTLKAFWNEI